jgi:hypothetical protein
VLRLHVDEREELIPIAEEAVQHRERPGVVGGARAALNLREDLLSRALRRNVAALPDHECPDEFDHRRAMLVHARRLYRHDADVRP